MVWVGDGPLAGGRSSGVGSRVDSWLLRYRRSDRDDELAYEGREIVNFRGRIWDKGGDLKEESLLCGSCVAELSLNTSFQAEQEGGHRPLMLPVELRRLSIVPSIALLLLLQLSAPETRIQRTQHLCSATTCPGSKCSVSLLGIRRP